MNRSSVEAIGLVLATLNLDDVYPAQRELLREALADAKNCDCERHKLSAAMWRNEAYKHAGTPLPWEPEELLQKEYERGFIDGMQKQMQSSVDKAVNRMATNQQAVAQEREACAKVVDDMAAYMEQEMEPSGAVDWVRQHAAAIRARGETK